MFFHIACEDSDYSGSGLYRCSFGFLDHVTNTSCDFIFWDNVMQTDRGTFNQQLISVLYIFFRCSWDVVTIIIYCKYKSIR